MKKTSFNDVKKCLKKRNANSHKGENGTLLVIGGCKDIVGAPALSALAAMRTGTDLVVVVAPEKTAFAINSFSPDFITKKMKGEFFAKKHLKELLAYAIEFDVVLLGPGIGRKKETKEFVKKFVSNCFQPIVVDADALRFLKGLKLNQQTLLLPHADEFKALAGKKISKNLMQTMHLVKETAEKMKCCILLKGTTDVVSDGKQIKLNKTGNAGMSVGGTGDVLAGIAAGFMALKNNCFDSANATAFVNGLIGDKLLKEKGFGFIASDFIELIPETIYKR